MKIITLRIYKIIYIDLFYLLFRMEREFNSDDSGRNTPREVVVTRSDTPGPTPAYIYSRVSYLF